MINRQQLLSLQMLLEGCQIYEEMGKSKIGKVYRATHPAVGNCVLKFLEGPLADKPEFLKIFFAGIKKLKPINHANIARVYQVGDPEHPFILRELVLGTSLEERIGQKHRLTGVAATQIVLQVAQGLSAGYPFGIVYKNLKPSNIILQPDETIRLVDLSLPPTIPAYIAPEIWTKQKSDVRADIYALGIIYYQLLAGEVPFTGDREIVKEAHLHQALSLAKLPFNIPDVICKIIKTMLNKKRDERYKNPSQLIVALQNALNEQGASVGPDRQALKTRRREKISPPDTRRMSIPASMNTGIMLSMNFCEDFAPEVDPTEVATVEVKALKNYGIARRHKQQPAKSDIEEVYLSKASLENDIERALQRVIFIELVQGARETLRNRIIHFPEQFEQEIIRHLQKSFRRECWLLKESDNPGEMEIEINLEQAYILRHFYYYEDQLQAALAEQESDALTEDDEASAERPRQASQGSRRMLGDLETIDQARMSIGAGGNLETIDQPAALNQEQTVDVDIEKHHSITDITLSSHGSKTATSQKQAIVRRNLRSRPIEVRVDLGNIYQQKAWTKFCREHNLKQGQHFDIKDRSGDNTQNIVIYSQQLEHYQKEQDNILRIKEFFQGDYDISELDRGGMGVVLKLIAKNDPTFLSLRPENHWARQRFAHCLNVIKDNDGRESVYAQIPKGTEFVVKVAFEGCEESLIREASILMRIAENSDICQTIIGSIQQGRLFALDDKCDQTRIGYYLLLEYASRGNTEDLYPKFPDGKLPPTVAFTMMYGMAQTLQKLQQMGIIHRDIKPLNILLDGKGVPKLTDFGLAITTFDEKGPLSEERRRLLRVIDEEFLRISRDREQSEQTLKKLRVKCQSGLPTAESENLERQISNLQNKIPLLAEKERQRAQQLKGRYLPITAQENASKGRFAGSIFYAAPEQFYPDNVLTTKCDVYQLGAVLFTMLTGKRPVEEGKIVDVMSRVLYPVKPKVTDFVQGNPVIETMSVLIERMMQHNPEDRIEVDDIRERLERTLFEYAEELRTAPTYETPADFDSPSKEQRWQHKVEFARHMHENCMATISELFCKIAPRIR